MMNIENHPVLYRLMIMSLVLSGAVIMFFVYGLIGEYGGPWAKFFAWFTGL